MDEQQDWLTPDVLDQISYSAARIARGNRYVSAEDLRSEGIIWVCQHPKRMSEYMETEFQKIGWRRFTSGIEQAMRKVVKTEKAHREGYDPDDEAYYGMAQIELCLPALWDQNYRLNGPSRDGREIASSNDPSEGGTWMVMVMDVENAWNRASMDARARAMLRYRYGGSRATFADVARAFEVSQTTAERYVKRALRAMQRELGGTKPGCFTGCECAGHRRAISNETARSITSHDYEE